MQTTDAFKQLRKLYIDKQKQCNCGNSYRDYSKML